MEVKKKKWKNSGFYKIKSQIGFRTLSFFSEFLFVLKVVKSRKYKKVVFFQIVQKQIHRRIIFSAF